MRLYIWGQDFSWTVAVTQITDSLVVFALGWVSNPPKWYVIGATGLTETMTYAWIWEFLQGSSYFRNIQVTNIAASLPLRRCLNRLRNPPLNSQNSRPCLDKPRALPPGI